MKTPLQPLIFDINYTPEMYSPLVQAYISPDVELSESVISCIYEAQQLAREMMYREKRD